MTRALLIPIALAVFAAGPAVQAQTLEDRLRAQLISVTQQLHDLQAKQATSPLPSADETRLKAELAASRAEVARLKRRARPAAEAAPAASEAELKTLTDGKASAEARLAAATAALDEANRTLTRTREALETAHTREAADQQTLERYRAKNIQALQVARYLLKAYQQVTVADVLARKEPVTGLARTRIEQIEQTYADQIYDSRLDVAPKPPPSAAAAPPAPAPAPKP